MIDFRMILNIEQLQKTIIYFCFVFFLTIECTAVFLILGSGPILYSDSSMYLLAAKLLGMGTLADFQSMPIPVQIGYPLLLSFFSGFLDDPYIGLLSLQAFFCIAIDCMIILTVYAIRKNLFQALCCGIISALTVDKIFMFASVMTEGTFLFFIVLSLLLFSFAHIKRSYALFILSVASMIFSGWFRLSSSVVWITLPLLFLAGLLAQDKGKQPSGELYGRIRTLGTYLAVFIAALLTQQLITPPKGMGNDPFRVLWYRTISLSPETQQEFLLDYPEYTDEYDTWTTSRKRPEFPGVQFDPFWDFDDTDVAVREQRWTYIAEHPLHWKTPMWMQIARHNSSITEATAWQGKVAREYLLQHPFRYVGAALSDFMRMLTNPYRAVFKSTSMENVRANYPGRFMLLSEYTLGPSTRWYTCVHFVNGYIAGGLERLTRCNAMFAFNFAVFVGLVLGLIVNRSVPYWCIALVCLGTIGLNCFFAGALPRYRILMTPYSGLFLLTYWDIISNTLKKQ